MVAKQQFKDVGTTYSYESRASAVLHDGQLIYSGWSKSDDWSGSVLGVDLASPTMIIGVGDSPYVRYEGSGLYFIEPNENGALRLTLMPDAEFIRPHWKELHTGEPVVKLDAKTKNRFELNIPGFEGTYWIYRRDGWRWHLLDTLEDGIRFEALPGDYLIEKQPLRIKRKLLDEGWGD